MKKFIATFDGLKFSESTMSYAIFLARHCSAHLVGVFLEDLTRHNYGAADITNYEGKYLDKHMHNLNDKDKKERDKNIEIFQQACKSGGLNYSIHRDRGVALQELLHESIYADLLIINSGETLSRHKEQLPTRFIENLLNDVQCPVLLVPPKYIQINKIVLLYDGEPSSVYAVRTCSYLFDHINDLDTEIISVKGPGASLHLPDNKLIKEFIKRHYPKAKYIVLKGIAEDEIIKYLHSEKKNPMIVLGAYRRTRLSRLFRHSMADILSQHLKMPLFIAHNK